MTKFPILKLKYPIKLDCGCANQKKQGYIGIDSVDYEQEIIWDLKKGIPFPDESVEDVNVSHFLEHLNNEDGKEFINEVLRVLVTGGTLTARQPHASHPTAFYPDHESFWNEARVESIARNEPKWEILENLHWGLELIFKLRKK